MKSKTKALIVVTSHNQLGTTGRPTGYYLPEVTHPYQSLVEKGIEVDIASPQGGNAPMDQRSFDLKDAVNKAFWENLESRAKLENTLRLQDVDPTQYSAIFFAGGHGVMWDFPNDETLQRIARVIYENDGVVSAVCHGPAALVNLKLSNGKYLIDGHDVAAFSNDEEQAAGLTQTMPFLLETALKDRGAKYTKAPLWQSHVVVSGKLVTGQNPASAREVGAKAAAILVKE